MSPAAVPAPGLAPTAAAFQDFMVSTCDVVTAAPEVGIPNIVTASSGTLLGPPFGNAAAVSGR